MFLVLVSLAFALAQDCQEIESQIANLSNTSSQYSQLSMYAFYSKLANKYSQLGDCYSDIGKPASEAYSKAGYYFKLAGDSYNADLEKKYQYYMSCGKEYSLAGDYQKSLECYSLAKRIASEHPELNINIEEINKRIYQLLTNTGKETKTRQQGQWLAWVVGGIVVLVIALGVFYITKKYK